MVTITASPGQKLAGFPTGAVGVSVTAFPAVPAVAVRFPKYCEEKTLMLPAVAGLIGCEKGTTTGVMRGAANALRAGLRLGLTTAGLIAWAPKCHDNPGNRQAMANLEKFVILCREEFVSGANIAMQPNSEQA
jgi:hypothetical protein